MKDSFSYRGILLCGLLGLCRVVACSANTGGSNGSNPMLGSAGGAAPYPTAPSTPAGASGLGGFAVSPPSSTGPSFFNIKDGGPGVVRTHDSSCGAVAEVPEQITVYKE